MSRNNNKSMNKGSKDKTYKRGNRGPHRGNPTRGSMNNVPSADNQRSDRLDSLNDLKWYTENPLLLEAAARLPFPNRPGMSFTLPVRVNNAVSTRQKFEVPGVMSLGYIPTIGYSDDVKSPASIAARELYAQIRKSYSSDLAVDGPDLLMYLFALDNIHAMIAHYKRIYGLSTIYVGSNYDFPELVLQALKIDSAGAKFIRYHKTEIWGALNALIMNANKFAIPSRFHIFSRHRWMNENVYGDEPSAMAQMYVFRPDAYFTIDDTGSTGTACKYHELIMDTSSVANFLKPLDDMITAMSEWGDAYTINGYMMRAFEGESMLSTELLPEDYRVAPVYVPEVLLQIENYHGLRTNYSHGDITQDPSTNTVLCTPKLTSLVATRALHAPVVNVHSDAPSVGDVTIATRLSAWAVITGTSTTPVIYCGTELPTSAGIVTFTNRTGKGVLQDVVLHNLADALTLVDSLTEQSWFTHSPLVVAYTSSDSSAALDYHDLRLFGDLHNVNQFEVETLQNIHRVCVYSEFNCFSKQ